MGVLPCHRVGCDNIMCDRWSPVHGYICNECFDELVESGPHTDVETFMGRRKEPKKNLVDAYDIYDQIFKDQRDS